MTEQEKNEIVETVWQRIEERTQPVGDLVETDSLSDFSTLPVIARDGSLKLCNAASLKGRDFRFEDFTPEQMETFQRKAADSVRVAEVAYDNGYLTLTL